MQVVRADDEQAALYSATHQVVIRDVQGTWELPEMRREYTVYMMRDSEGEILCGG